MSRPTKPSTSSSAGKPWLWWLYGLVVMALAILYVVVDRIPLYAMTYRWWYGFLGSVVR